MDASRPGTAGVAPAENERGDAGRQHLIAAGGAWIGNLTALAPYKPLFVAGTAGVLGYGFYLVYWKPRHACADGAACARPIPNRFVKLALLFATVLVAAAFAFDYVAPALLGA
jgi:mercuric ion transport protein